MNLFLLFSHKLTDCQIEEAIDKFGCNKFVYLPTELQKTWSNIPPQEQDILKYFTYITAWLLDNSQRGDYVIVQGDFGATYSMVGWCFENNLIPIYSTTEREYSSFEKKDGSVQNIHTFKHIIFREYQNIKET